MRVVSVAGALLLWQAVAGGLLAREPLSFEERVRAQEAIERVYYAHRIWPKENPGPKPPFEQRVSRAQLEAKVADSLEKSAALDRYWQRPIEPAQLQAEMDRMAKQSQDPATLRELFAALGDDPYLIAECLARPILADRLTARWHQGRCETGTPVSCLNPGADAGENSVFLFRLPEVGPHSACGDTWRQTQLRSPLDGRRYHTCVWTGSEMIVWGGENGPTSLNSGSRYNPATDTWTPTSSGGGCPSARQLHVAVWTGTKMIVWGGLRYSTALSDGALYDPTTDSWSRTSPGSGLAARFNHTAVWTGSEMIVWGGTRTGGDYLTTGGRYSPFSDTWTLTSTAAGCPQGRREHTAVWTGSGMIVWGGYGPTGYLGSGGVYTPASDTWSATPVLEVGRVGHTAVWTGSKMIIWGGEDGWSARGDGAAFDPSTFLWAPLTGAGAPAPRWRHSAIWTGTKMVIWGGEGGWPPVEGGAIYDPSSDGWTSTSSSGAPSVRSEHTAVWTGTEMIVWGGIDPEYTNLLSDGARFRPDDNSWVPLSPGAGAPSPRSEQSTVWTGVEMIVWGGYPAVATGGRYTPATDSWSPTGTGEACPAARSRHSAVWTGADMIVWGGADDTLPLNTGGRYNPVTDSWAATSTGTGLPAPCSNHQAFWTGTEMVIWGCYVWDSPGTGGRYNPSTDSWRPTSTGSGCPSPRSNFSSVWTGAEMIVWGGQGGTPLNDGARYDPVADAWRPLSAAAGCPSPRAGASAVWTGNRMVIWGGSWYDSQNYYHFENSGGVYDPATDTWTPTSQGAGCPSPRGGHSALWTPRGMVVWGGLTGPYLPTSTGGLLDLESGRWTPTATDRYCPPERGGHSAVWTGQEMIVWGGMGERTGGVYEPPSLLTPGIRGPDSGCGQILLATGEYSSYQWFLDGVALSGATERTWLAIQSGGYSVVVGDGAGCSRSSQEKTVVVDPLPSPAIVGADANSCPTDTVLLTATGGFASYEWRCGGVPIGGATSDTYAATLSGQYTVQATDFSGCDGLSPTKTVTLNFCSTTETSPAGAVYAARLVRDAASPTGYYLYFQKAGDATGYNLYEGKLGTWYSHRNAPGNQCHAAVTDLGTGEMRAAITPSAGNHYYLVSAYQGKFEGPTGFNSSGTQIPVIQSSCAP